MKFHALHPKKNFLGFLSLAILVLAGSVGVILATQKQIFDEPSADSGCGCAHLEQLGNQNCVGAGIYTTCKRNVFRKFITPVSRCQSGYVCESGYRCNVRCVKK